MFSALMLLIIKADKRFAPLISSCLVLLYVCVFVQFGNKAVAHVACDVFQLLISHWEHLQRLEPTLPKKIIEVTCTHTELTFSVAIRGL